MSIRVADPFSRGEGGGGGGVYYQSATGEARTTPFRVTTAQTSLGRREREAPAAENCPAVSSPLPLNPLEIYCHALSRRPPCHRVEESLYEENPVTAGSTGRGDSSVGAVIVTALVTGRKTELRRFQISPDHLSPDRVPPKRRLLVVEGESSHRRCTCCRGGESAWRHRYVWSDMPA